MDKTTEIRDRKEFVVPQIVEAATLPEITHTCSVGDECTADKGF